MPSPRSARTRHLAKASTLATAGVVACCILAALLALRHLGTKPLWVDEAASWVAARKSVPDLLGMLRQTDANSGLYYLLLHFWLRLGHGQAWDRGLSAVFGIGAVGAAGWCGGRWRGPVAAVGAALLLAVNPFWLYYSQEMRSYSLALLLAVVSTGTLLGALRRPDRPRLAAYWVATTLLIYADLFSILFVASQAAVLFWRGQGRRLLPAWVATAICSAPLNLYMVIVERNQVSWLGRPTPLILVHTVLAYTAHAFGLVLLAPLSVAAVLSHRARRDTDLTWPLVIAATAPFIVLWLVSQVDHLFIDRYLIASLAAIVLVAAAGLAELCDRHLVVVAGVLAGALCVVGLSYDQHLYHEPFKNDDPRSAARYIAARDKTGDLIVYTNDYLRLPVDLYLPPTGRPIDIALADSSEAEAGDRLYPKEVSAGVLAGRLADAKRVWVIARSDDTASEAAARVSLTNRLGPTQTAEFGNMRVWLWSSPIRTISGST